MKNTDDHLREVLRDKLNDYESPVPDALWQNVSSQLPQVKPLGGGLSLGKIAALAAVGAGVTAAVLFLSRSTPEISQHRTSQSVQSTSTDTASNQAFETPQVVQAIPAEQSPVKTTATVQNNTGPAPDEETGRVHIQAPGNTPEQTTAIAETTSKEDPATAQAIAPATPSDPITKTDPRFSVVEMDKSGLSFFFIPQHTDATHYTWSFGDGEISTEMSPSHHYDEAGEYTVELKIEGVAQVFNQTVSAFPTPILEAPTIFTPNADGKNDSFDIMALSRYVTLETVRVFNSSGIPVYQGDGNTVWNGEDNLGNPLPEGNYIYTLKAKDLRQQPVEKSGTVYLRR